MRIRTRPLRAGRALRARLHSAPRGRPAGAGRSGWCPRRREARSRGRRRDALARFGKLPQTRCELARARHGAEDSPPHARAHSQQARRIAVRAQMLDTPRPTDLLAVAQRLTLLQIDPTAAIAPNADLVLWSRLGSAYDPAELKRAVEQDRTLFEHDAMIRPVGDVGLYLAGCRRLAAVRAHPRVARGQRRVSARHPRAARGVRAAQLASEIPDTCAVPWASTGWTHNRNVTQMLECMMMRGEVAIAGREGRQRLWDLAERVYPAERGGAAGGEAERLKDERRLGALGIAGARAPSWRSTGATSARPASRPSSRASEGEWRVDPALPRPASSRAAPRSSRRLTGWFTTACVPSSCSGSSTCWRCTSRRPTPLGLLRAADPARRSADRQARREGRPQGVGATRLRDPRGREVHEGDDEGRAAPNSKTWPRGSG